MTPTPAQSGLSVDSLTVRFDGHPAVNTVSLAVAEKSVLALVGPSGCGKSTLLRAVAGLVIADEGAVGWNGADITNKPAHQRDIGLMFQNHALFSHRSVAQNIGFGLRMRGDDRLTIRQRVGELLDLVGLVGFEKRQVQSLSGGEAQRVALARAVAPAPALLLLDEPLASLDRARRVELNAELGALLRTLGQTAIYVTHDQHEAFAVADEVGVMNAGCLVRVGTPTEIWNDPQTEFVARFVGHETIIDYQGARWAVPAAAVELVHADEDQDDCCRATVIECRFEGDRCAIKAADAQGTVFTSFASAAKPLGTHVLLRLHHDRFALIG